MRPRTTTPATAAGPAALTFGLASGAPFRKLARFGLRAAARLALGTARRPVLRMVRGPLETLRLVLRAACLASPVRLFFRLLSFIRRFGYSNLGASSEVQGAPISRNLYAGMANSR